MSFLLNDQIYQQDPSKGLMRRLQALLERMGEKWIVVGSSEKGITCKVFFTHPKREEVKVETIWVFRVEQEMMVSIQAVEGANLNEIDKSIAYNDILAQVNRQSVLGNYFINSCKPELLLFKATFSSTLSRQYMASIVSQLHRHAQFHFINYYVRLKLLGQFSEPVSDDLQRILMNIQRLKEHIQLERQKRPKATKYDLTNCSLRVINEARRIIQLNFSLLKKYKLTDSKMDKKRRQQCESLFHNLRKQYERDADINSFIPILNGMEIIRVVKEQMLDQSKLSVVYRGIYEISLRLTVNPSIFEGEKMKVIADQASRVFVRKTPIPNAPDRLSFTNELEFLNFVRMKSCSRIGEYFLAMDSEDRMDNNSIYIKYYPCSLAQKITQWPFSTLLQSAFNLMEAINFLYENNILHRDLKEWNVMVDESGKIRLIDFGSVSGMSTNAQVHFPCKKKLMSTPGYYQPYRDLEGTCRSVFQKFKAEQYNQSSTFDVFSYGVILSHMFGLQRNYDSPMMRELSYLSQKCTELNPDDRIRPKQVLVFMKQLMELGELQNKVYNEKHGVGRMFAQLM